MKNDEAVLVVLPQIELKLKRLKKIRTNNLTNLSITGKYKMRFVTTGLLLLSSIAFALNFRNN